jgi:O-antigen ligase
MASSQLRARFMAANYGVSRDPLRATAQKRASGYYRLLGLRGLPADYMLLLAYVFLDGSYIGDEARLGIKIGPMPIFVTDAVLLAVIAICIRKHGGRLMNWGFTGGGAGAVGRAVWLLFLIALVNFALAFPEYRLLAVRDLAIFGYSIFFPLTYFTLGQRILAAKLIRYFIYAICIGAAIFNFQLVSGLHLFKLFHSLKGLPGHLELAHPGAGNLGNIGAALSGIFAYFAAQRTDRRLHAGLMLLCLATLAQVMDRSSFIGFFMAAALMFLLGVGRSRFYAGALGTTVIALLLVSAQGELPIPGGARLHGLSEALFSGTNMQSDPDGAFRLQRWHSAIQFWMTSPAFGVGFGAPIIAKDEWIRSEVKGAAERTSMGSFNEGMPHNTFLMILARIGPLGLGLVVFAWIATIVRILKALRRVPNPDLLAMLGILIASVPVAGLNLFFERPMMCAPFWITLAAGYKLAESSPVPIARARVRSGLDNATWIGQQHSSRGGWEQAARDYDVRRLALANSGECKLEVD